MSVACLGALMVLTWAEGMMMELCQALLGASAAAVVAWRVGSRAADAVRFETRPIEQALTTALSDLAR